MRIALDAMGGDHAPGPIVAGAVPTLRGASVVGVVGGNVRPKAEHLFQYGVLGSVFARRILRRDRPTIGLMNVGSEEQKGHDLAKETHALFNSSALREQFVG